MERMNRMANDLLNLADEARKIAICFDDSIERIMFSVSLDGTHIIMQTQDGQEITVLDDEDAGEVACSTHTTKEGWRHWDRVKRNKD